MGYADCFEAILAHVTPSVWRGLEEGVFDVASLTRRSNDCERFVDEFQYEPWHYAKYKRSGNSDTDRREFSGSGFDRIGVV